MFTRLRAKRICFIFSLALVFNCKKEVSEQSDKPQKPNILFVLVDDLGVHDLGYTGSTFYETPHVDALSKEAMNFTQGYAASRVCSPSRASIMTGKFTARHGITDWIGAKADTAWRSRKRFDKLLPANYVQHLPHNDTTIAEALKQEGYATFFAGKWHLGGKDSYPEHHGFEINKGGFHRGGPAGGFFAPWKNPKLKSRAKGENLTMRLAEETAAFIAQHKDTTFFAFLSFYAVHAPIQTTEAKWNKYRAKAHKSGLVEKGYAMERVLPVRQVQDNPIYGGLVETMDDAVGVVLKALKDNGLEKNTIVVFTSDNGGVASGDNYATSNLPLRGGKGYQWEGGIRAPFLIKVPWLHTAGQTTDVPVISTDIYPTLLDLAGIPTKPQQHVDGVSLKPLLQGKQIANKRPLYWHYPHYGNQGGNPSSVIQKNGWKLIHYWEDGTDELYKLPSEEKDHQNVIEAHPELANTLKQELLKWLKHVNAKLPTKDETYDAKKAAKRQLYIRKEKLPSLEAYRVKILQDTFQPNNDWWKSKVVTTTD